MSENEPLNITVLIAGRPYPLKINASDEETIRKIVKEANDKINRFQLTYPQKDKQDCLAMALLTIAVELQKIRLNNDNMIEINSQIQTIDDMLSSALQKTQGS